MLRVRRLHTICHRLLSSGYSTLYTGTAMQHSTRYKQKRKCEKKNQLRRSQYKQRARQSAANRLTVFPFSFLFSLPSVLFLPQSLSLHVIIIFALPSWVASPSIDVQFRIAYRSLLRMICLLE
jgi:hypothetical protein